MYLPRNHNPHCYLTSGARTDLASIDVRSTLSDAASMLSVSLNLHRRHLDESQRAMIAAQVANMKTGRSELSVPIGTLKSLSDAASMLNVSRRTVVRAREVLNAETPTLTDAVNAGRITVSAAAELARVGVREGRKRASRNACLTTH